MFKSTAGCTIVTTMGKILQTGTQGLRVVAECETPLLDIGEVSDCETINAFIYLAPYVKLDQHPHYHDQREILIPREQIT